MKAFKIILGSIIAISASILFFTLVLTKDGGNKSAGANKRLELNAEQIKVIHDLEKNDFLRSESSTKTAYISTSFWNRLDYKGKEDLSAALAIYVTNAKGDNLYHINIYDKMTGKKLAKYSKSWGFSIE